VCVLNDFPETGFVHHMLLPCGTLRPLIWIFSPFDVTRSLAPGTSGPMSKRTTGLKKDCQTRAAAAE
jgi:hypothetical protein